MYRIHVFEQYFDFVVEITALQLSEILTGLMMACDPGDWTSVLCNYSYY